MRKTQSRPNHKGRVALPDHLPVEEIQIYPEGDLSTMVCIGKEVTEELEVEPARFYIKRYCLTTSPRAERRGQKAYWMDLKGTCKPMDMGSIKRLVPGLKLPTWPAGQIGGRLCQVREGRFSSCIKYCKTC